MKRLLVLSHFILALLPAFVVARSTPDAASLSKVAEFKMAKARIGAAVVALGNHLYVLGGSGDGEPIVHAERIDLASQTTELLPHRFLARRYHTAIEHKGKIYIFGGDGYDRADRLLEKRVEVFDPAEGTVSIVGETADPRRFAGAVKIGHEAWIIGGGRLRPNGAYSQTNEVAIFDLEQHTWRKGPPMPTPRESKAVVVGQFVLVAGGYAARNSQKAVEMFVPQENVWKRLPDLEQPISAHSPAVLGRTLFLFGDYQDGSTILAYDLPTKTTARLKVAGFTECRHSAAVTVGDRIYLVGGYTGDGRGRGRLGHAEGVERDGVQVFELTGR